MRGLLLFLAVMAAAFPAWSRPRVTSPNTTRPYAVTVTFSTGDTSESQEIPVSGFCTVRYEQVSGDDASLYAIASADDPTSSGTLIAAFTSSTTAATTFTAGTSWVKAVATDATAGGSKMTIECAPQSASASGSTCLTGTTKGGGYDAATDTYDWTCGNYPWSAEYGGVDANGYPDYYTPTTGGGNSWTLLCTGDGTASNGTAAEGTNCLSNGERIRMYGMADIMLAHDHTKQGGTIYLPEGSTHDGYCGQDADGNPNNCPVTRLEPWHQTRKISMFGNRKLVGVGADHDGPVSGGADGTWIIMDSGSDSDSNASNGCGGCDDPGGSGTPTFDHWTLRSGLDKTNLPLCAMDSGDTACDALNASVVNYMTSTPSKFPYRTGIIVAGDTSAAGGLYQICIDNDITTAGVCDEDTRVKCTANSGGRLSATTGDCSVVSGTATCIGLAAAANAYQDELQADGAANDPLYLAVEWDEQATYGDDAAGTQITSTYLAQIADVTATTCDSGNGLLATIGGWWDATNARFMQGPLPAYDVAHQSGSGFFIDNSKWMNADGGYRNLSIRPGVWVGRESATAAADCPTVNQGGNCDEMELAALGSAMGGGYDNVGFWGGSSNGFAFSIIDGDDSGLNTWVRNSTIKHGQGTLTDSSFFLFENNEIADFDVATSGTALILGGFRDGGSFKNNYFHDLEVSNLFRGQPDSGPNFTDNRFENIDCTGGLFRIEDTRHAFFQRLTGNAINCNPIFIISPDESQEGFNVFVSDVLFRNVSIGNSNYPQSIIARTDYNNTAAYESAQVRGLMTFRNIAVSVHGDDSWAIMHFDGETGAGGDADSGSGTRAVDDDRNHFDLENIVLEVYNDGTKAGTQRAFNFGNQDAAGNAPGDAESYQFSDGVEGPLPRWVNLMVANQRYPDNQYASMTGAEAGDCQNLAAGTIVLIHDDTVAGGCTDAGADGILDGGAAEGSMEYSTCICDPAGDAGDGAWSALY